MKEHSMIPQKALDLAKKSGWKGPGSECYEFDEVCIRKHAAIDPQFWISLVVGLGDSENAEINGRAIGKHYCGLVLDGKSTESFWDETLRAPKTH